MGHDMTLSLLSQIRVLSYDTISLRKQVFKNNLHTSRIEQEQIRFILLNPNFLCWEARRNLAGTVIINPYFLLKSGCTVCVL